MRRSIAAIACITALTALSGTAAEAGQQPRRQRACSQGTCGVAAPPAVAGYAYGAPAAYRCVQARPAPAGPVATPRAPAVPSKTPPVPGKGTPAVDIEVDVDIDIGAVETGRAAGTAPPAGKAWQLADHSGQLWQHDDAAGLVAYVDAINAGVGKPAVSGQAVLADKLPPRGAIAYVAAQHGDAYGFTAWLNGVRARHGRGPVGHDPNLSAWASANNGQQHARGMGHHVMGSARRQNSGVGDGGTVWQMWMASPAHQAALLDPTITMIGISASGSYWTFNAY